MKIDVELKWNTMDCQGPMYEPFTTYETIYADGPITKSEIDRVIVEANPNKLIQKIDIVNVLKS